MVDQTQPWAERTVEVSPRDGVGVPPQREPFQRGVAQVGAPRTPRTEQFSTVSEEGTGDEWSTARRPDLPLSYRMAQLRSGGEWSVAGALFAFVCWGVWAISARGDLTSPMIIFGFSLLVAVGLFTLARLVGRVIWERQLGRVRRSARGAHLVTAVFLVGVGLTYLRQTEWIVSAWNWIAN